MLLLENSKPILHALLSLTPHECFSNLMGSVKYSFLISGECAAYLTQIVPNISNLSQRETILDRDVIGQSANLIDSIGEGMNGQVSCIIRGREITYLARSSDGKAINRGTPVKIVGKTGGIVTVQPDTE